MFEFLSVNFSVILVINLQIIFLLKFSAIQLQNYIWIAITFNNPIKTCFRPTVRSLHRRLIGIIRGRAVGSIGDHRMNNFWSIKKMVENQLCYFFLLLSTLIFLEGKTKHLCNHLYCTLFAPIFCCGAENNFFCPISDQFALYFV